jgi:hypothetical protein
VSTARQQQLAIFAETFYENWNTKVLRSRTDYFDSINAAALAAGLPPGTVPPGAIPSFEQLSGGAATRTSGGATSAGTVVAGEQFAQTSGANPINPPGQVIIPPLLSPAAQDALLADATRFANDVNRLASRLLTGEQSQATQPGNVNLGSQKPSPPDIAYINDQGRLNPRREGPDAGVGAGTTPGAFQTDDAARSNSGATKEVLRQQIDQLYGTSRLISNQRNVLSEFENYSYQLSWYIAPPSFYNKFSNYRNIPDYFLLAQSGGAAAGAGSVQSQQGIDAVGSIETAVPNVVSTASRNPFFLEDFYIDNFDIVTRFPLAGTRMSHSTTEISFTLTEPYGLSLIPRLQNAVEDVYKQAGVFTGQGARYSSALYIMVVKFWGVKQDGTLERVITRTANGTPIGPVEKYIPFVIRELRFSQGSRFVEYRIVGAPPFSYVGFGQERGILLEKYTLTGRTVKDALAGQTAATGTSAAATATGTQNAAAAAATDGRLNTVAATGEAVNGLDVTESGDNNFINGLV